MSLSDRETLQKWVEESQRVVFFGGAGVSTESGIPDFRSTDGLYHRKYAYPPEEILSHSFFERNPEEFYRFYWDKMIAPEAKPNAAHRALAKLEADGKLTAVVTQNIDGLHQKAGSREVYELHGCVRKNHCVRCGRFYSLEDLPTHSGVPHCSCGGIIKPDVVLYEESLPEKTVEGACRRIEEAELLIIGGTSLTVYPAAGFIRYFHGRHLVLINRSVTPMDEKADLVIRDRIGEVLSVFLSP